jgi:type III secretory pathway component EscS
MNQLLWNTIIVAGPVLAAALVVGLLVSVLQVATQLQEKGIDSFGGHKFSLSELGSSTTLSLIGGQLCLH